MDELLLLLSSGEYISGERISEALGITRGAIWKRIERLREQGYRIDGVSKRGYRLLAERDSLLPAYIACGLNTEWAGRGDIYYAHEMDSTNLRMREFAREGAPHGSLAVCDVQTAGRGRLGRGWQSEGGAALTFSLLLRPPIHPEQAQLYTLAAAVAVAGAIRELCPALKPRIKWPNDVVIGGKKCVGILCELSANTDSIEALIIGVGVNVNQSAFDGELADKATSLRIENGGRTLCRRELLCAFLTRIEHTARAVEREGISGIRREYEAMSATLGSAVRVISPGGEYTGTAYDIDDTGALLVRDERGEGRRVLAGDVSVRGIMGYAD